MSPRNTIVLKGFGDWSKSDAVIWTRGTGRSVGLEPVRRKENIDVVFINIKSSHPPAPVSPPVSSCSPSRRTRRSVPWIGCLSCVFALRLEAALLMADGVLWLICFLNCLSAPWTQPLTQITPVCSKIGEISSAEPRVLHRKKKLCLFFFNLQFYSDWSPQTSEGY